VTCAQAARANGRIPAAEIVITSSIIAIRFMVAPRLEPTVAGDNTRATMLAPTLLAIPQPRPDELRLNELTVRPA
jgi:hypothetical protein